MSSVFIARAAAVTGHHIFFKHKNPRPGSPCPDIESYTK